MVLQLFENIYHRIEVQSTYVEYCKSYVEKPLQYLFDLAKEGFNCSIPAFASKGFEHFKGSVAILSIPKTVTSVQELFVVRDSKAPPFYKSAVGTRQFFKNVRTFFTAFEHLDKVITYGITVISGHKAIACLERVLGKPMTLIFKAVAPTIGGGIESDDIYQQNTNNGHLSWIRVAFNVCVVATLVLSALQAGGYVIPCFTAVKLTFTGIATLLGIVIGVWKDVFENEPLVQVKLS